MKYLIWIILLLVLIYFYFNFKFNHKKENYAAIVYILIHPKLYDYYENYIYSLIYKFKNNNIECVIIKEDKYNDVFFNNYNTNVQYIIFQTLNNINISTTTKYKIIKNTYIINTEELTNKIELSRILKYIDEGYKIIDYNIANIRILDKNYTINNIYYIPYQVNYEEIYKNRGHSKNICIIDPYATSHRKSIYMKTLSTNFLQINIISGKGVQKDKEIIKHKILLNTHINNNITSFESIVCDRFIFNKVVILSEYSNSKSIPDDLKQYIVEYLNAEDLNNKLEIIANNPQKYYDNFWNDFNLKLIDTNREKYFNYLVKEFNIYNNDLIMNLDINDKIKDNSAFVINLDKRTDRWYQIKKLFKNSSINLIRVSAIKKNDGHLGCGLSFMKIVRYAKENNLKSVLIFEDDNMPLDNFDSRWLTIKKWLDNNLDKWEIYNGGARFLDWQTYNKKVPNINNYDVKLFHKINHNEYLFKNDLIVSTNWMYINFNCYDKLLKWLDIQTNIRFLVPIDQYINNSKNFNCVFSIPQLALQYNSKSDTSFYENDLDNYDKTILELSNKIYKKYMT